MKKIFCAFLFVSLLFCSALADTYLWDVPLGIPIGEAVQLFEKNAGIELYPYKDDNGVTTRYKADDVWISGAQYDVIVYFDSNAAYSQLSLFMRDFSSTDLYDSVKVRSLFSVPYRMLNMLYEKLGSPAYAGLEFYTDAEYSSSIYFDIPVSGNEFDPDFLCSISSPISSPSIRAVWDHVFFSFGYYISEEYNELSSCSIEIYQQPSIDRHIPEYCGAYNPDVLSSKIGITSF